MTEHLAESFSTIAECMGGLNATAIFIRHPIPGLSMAELADDINAYTKRVHGILDTEIRKAYQDCTCGHYYATHRGPCLACVTCEGFVLATKQAAPDA